MSYINNITSRGDKRLPSLTPLLVIKMSGFCPASSTHVMCYPLTNSQPTLSIFLFQEQMSVCSVCGEHMSYFYIEISDESGGRVTYPYLKQ